MIRDLEGQVAALRAKIEAEPDVWKRIALYNDPAVPFAVRVLAISPEDPDE